METSRRTSVGLVRRSGIRSAWMGDPETVLPADASAPGDQPADSGTWSVTVEGLASDHNLPDKPAVRDGRIYLSAMRGLRTELQEIQNREPPGTSASARDGRCGPTVRLDASVRW